MLRKVVIYPKKPGPRSRELQTEIKELGINQDFKILTGRIYIFKFKEQASSREAEKLAAKITFEILMDPVAEEYFPGTDKKGGVAVEVYFKKGVLDIEGRTAEEAAGYAELNSSLESISRGDRYIFSSPDSIKEDTCRYIAGKLLFNEIIQEAVFKWE